MAEGGITRGERDRAAAYLTVIVGKERFCEFFTLLQQGVGMTARVPVTLKELLCGQFGLPADYVSERITTIFLNSRPTDDIDGALVGDRATVALSAAMPGLVGATMRRGGFYAAMRSSITLREQETAACCGVGQVRVKLFNLLLNELGPEFLQRGILLGRAEMADFFRERDEWFWAGCGGAILNGTPLEPDRLRDGEALAALETVRLSVIFRKEA